MFYPEALELIASLKAMFQEPTFQAVFLGLLTLAGLTFICTKEAWHASAYRAQLIEAEERALRIQTSRSARALRELEEESEMERARR